MTCGYCQQPGKRFRMLPDGKHQKPWCQKCPDPRYVPRKQGERPQPPKKEQGK